MSHDELENFPTMYVNLLIFIWSIRKFLPPANEVWGKVIFLHLFVILFTGGACMVAPGGGCMVAPGGGGVWLLPGGMHGCSRGGMHGCSRGACMVAPGGHAWLLPGGMHGCSQGACMVAPRGACMVAPGGACMVALGGACVVAPRGGMCGCSGGVHVWLLPGGHAWDMMRYGDMINEWVVHILLECILVTNVHVSDTVVKLWLRKISGFYVNQAGACTSGSRGALGAQAPP